MTNIKKLISEIKNCTSCPLHKTACQKVIYRGVLPADIIFIGEAPGPSENAIGSPFIGPAGKLLDNMIEAVGVQQKFVITNSVMCMPSTGSTFREPTTSEIQACNANLMKLINIQRPQAIVTLGAVAKKAVSKSIMTSLSSYGTVFIHLAHPAYILRKKPADRLAEKTKWELTLSEALINAGLLTDPENMVHGITE